MEIDGGEQLGRRRQSTAAIGGRAAEGVAVVQRREGVGEERAVGGGEGGDEAADTWVGGGGPLVVADVTPEVVLGGESAELEGRGGSGGEGWAVESGQDVGLKNVGVDGGDRRATTTAVIDGGQ